MNTAPVLTMVVRPGIPEATESQLFYWARECSDLLRAIRQEQAKRRGDKEHPWDANGPKLHPDSGLTQHAYQATVPAYPSENKELTQAAHERYISEPLTIDHTALRELSKLQKEWLIEVDGQSRHLPGMTCRIIFRRPKVAKTVRS